MVAISENDVDDVISFAVQHGLRGEVVKSRGAGIEKLFVIMFARIV